MRMPRDVSADELVKALKKFCYFVSHRKGSHIRVTTIRNGEHHETIPNHSPIKIGTLSKILHNLARHHNMTVETLLSELNL
jgi:predicted RNA binding protein YcfA (HicA-like mRNA interferase family)